MVIIFMKPHVIPRALIGQILKVAHEDLGYNGTHRTYIMLKRLYYWKGLKPSVEKYIITCYQCQRRNKQVVRYAALHFDVGTFPMQFFSWIWWVSFTPLQIENISMP